MYFASIYISVLGFEDPDQIGVYLANESPRSKEYYHKAGIISFIIYRMILPFMVYIERKKADIMLPQKKTTTNLSLLLIVRRGKN